jgi:hypothetical protein
MTFKGRSTGWVVVHLTIGSEFWATRLFDKLGLVWALAIPSNWITELPATATVMRANNVCFHLGIRSLLASMVKGT